MPRSHHRSPVALVVYAKNKRRVSAFYRRTLGVEPIEEASSHDLLRGNGVELVIHAIPRKYAAGIDIARPPHVRTETPLKPVFFVDSLDAARAAAVATGGALQPPEKAWRYDGAVVLDGYDPEGNVVQFRQRDKSR